MLTCKEASLLISTAQDRELRLHERLGLRLHLWMCGNCRRFERQVRMLGRVFRSQANAASNADQDDTLSAEARERISRMMSEQKLRDE